MRRALIFAAYSAVIALVVLAFVLLRTQPPKVLAVSPARADDFSGGCLYINGGCGIGGAAFTPATPTGLQLWLDASNAGSITQSGGFVSQWNDLSATAATFTEATAGLQPAYVASAIGGKPAISPSGASSTLGCLVDTGAHQFLGTGATEFTIWIVTQANGATFSIPMTFHANGSGNDPQLGFATSDHILYNNLYFGASLTGGFGLEHSSTSFGAAAPYAITLTYNGGGPGAANYAFYASNVSQTVVDGGSGTDTVAHTVVGANDNAGGDPVLYIAEIAIYNRVLTGTERGQLQTYGNAKYGL